MKRKELNIEELKGLADESEIYILYLDYNEFDLKYCDTVHNNIYYDSCNMFIDVDDNEMTLKELIDYVNQGQIKVYSTENTILKNKPSNYNKIKNMSIEEMAEDRLIIEYTYDGYISYKRRDFKGEATSKEEAIKKEIEWLKQESK